MRIRLASVFVDDQAKALRFYTEVLGFVKKADVPVGAFRWLTVISPEGPEDLELVLEPNENPAARAYQRAIHDQGIPATAFFSDDLERECERLRARGVVFRTEPTRMAWGSMAIFEDTCGNLIQVQEIRAPPADRAGLSAAPP